MKDIASDLSSGYSMHRLLQGDVGSGKTVVGLYAVMCAYRNDYQSAFMAPTEILALQHYRTAVELLNKFGLNIALLTGQLRKKEREDILNRIENGKVHLVIGTHAILQEDVIFHNLALCITDEQHRFGVQQRLILSSKGVKPHLLVMSATPIPRTLALILYGDLDISTLKELPKNRKKVLTYSVDESFRQRINNFIQKIVVKGEQAFVVCPAIYENDVLDVTNVLTKYEQLQTDIPSVKSAVLHGKMKKVEKNEVMEKFINNEISVLVTTSIIEVGIDIPNATLMVIEDAQQFGLSQLHQLRGRVGRSDKQSYCILFNQSSSDISKKRMDVMVQSNDGFYISEQDLLLRGPGDFFGTKQHGLPDFKIANLYTDMDILKDAQKAVQEEIRNNAIYRQLLGRELDYLSKAKL
jgi:ATP-dependent DNA helicase RecG